MADIFLAYSRTDSVKALAIAGRLRAEGWSVFMDVQTLVGERWHKALKAELQRAKVVVVLWSKASVESDFVLEEAEIGKQRGVLFPAFIERVEYPYGFARVQTADIVGALGANHRGLIELVSALRARIATPSLPSAPAVQSNRKESTQPSAPPSDLPPEPNVGWLGAIAKQRAGPRKAILTALFAISMPGLAYLWSANTPPTAKAPLSSAVKPNAIAPAKSTRPERYTFSWRLAGVAPFVTDLTEDQKAEIKRNIITKLGDSRPISIQLEESVDRSSLQSSISCNAFIIDTFQGKFEAGDPSGIFDANSKALKFRISSNVAIYLKSQGVPDSIINITTLADKNSGSCGVPQVTFTVTAEAAVPTI